MSLNRTRAIVIAALLAFAVPAVGSRAHADQVQWPAPDVKRRADLVKWLKQGRAELERHRKQLVRDVAAFEAPKLKDAKQASARERAASKATESARMLINSVGGRIGFSEELLASKVVDKASEDAASELPVLRTELERLRPQYARLHAEPRIVRFAAPLAPLPPSAKGAFDWKKKLQERKACKLRELDWKTFAYVTDTNGWSFTDRSGATEDRASKRAVYASLPEPTFIDSNRNGREEVVLYVTESETDMDDPNGRTTETSYYLIVEPDEACVARQVAYIDVGMFGDLTPVENGVDVKSNQLEHYRWHDGLLILERSEPAPQQ